MSRSLAPSIVSLALAALACAFVAPRSPVFAEAAPDAPMSWVTLTVDPGLPTKLHLTSRTPADPAIAPALERIAGRPAEASEYAEGWIMWAADLPAPSRGRLLLRQPLALEPLLEVMSAAGQPNLTIAIRHPRVGFATLTGARLLAQQPEYTSAVIPTRGPRQALALELGWRRADVARGVAVVLVALLLPIAAGLIVRARSIARDRAPEAWFGRAQAINVIVMAGWVQWMVAVEGTRIADLTESALGGPTGYAMITIPLWMLAFLPTSFALAAIQRDVIRRLRGFDPMPRGGSFGFPAQMRFLLPLVLVLGAITAFGAGNPRAGVFALLGAIIAGVFMPGGRGPLGMTPQALSSGALRDRLFEMARRAGVKLRELYVVPLRRERLANAFAVNGGVVMVADELLDRMSRREVDALLAYEISHLEHHHPLKTLLAAAGGATLAAVVAIPTGIPFVFPAAVVAAWLTSLFVARRFEFAADAGAAALSGDAEGVISGLGRLARLNDSPLAWGRAMGWLITHPTTEARGLVVGRRAGLAPERVRELLAHGLPCDEHYGHAERPGEEARVFSTQWKAGVLARLSLAVLTAAVVAPAAALALARALGWEPPHVIAIPAGFALGLGAVLLAHDRLAARPVARLEGALRQRLADWPGGATVFVALSPGDRARVYEGFLDWDLGTLSIEPDRLHYRGEQIALELPRHAVQAIEIGAAMPSWIRAPRVIVRWSAPAGEAALSLRVADARRVSAIGPGSRALAARLRAWHGAGGTVGDGPRDTAGGGDDGGAARSQVACVAPPAIGPVTSSTPAEAAGLRDLPLMVALIGAFSAGAGFLLGLDLWRGLDVFAAAVLALVAVRWPAVTSRERPSPPAIAPASERRAA